MKERTKEILRVLSGLEVESSYAEGKDEGKKDGECDKDGSNWSHEVRLEPVIVLNVLLNGESSRASEDGDRCLHVTILRHNQSIDGPCDRADPVVPYPPLGDLWSWDEEAREEVENAVKRRSKDGSDLLVWREGNSHHAVIGPVKEGEVAYKKEPEELGSCPLEPNHGIDDEGVVSGLNKNIWKLTGDLGDGVWHS